MTRIIIVGSGVAGSEVGTYLGQYTEKPLEIIEIECEPTRQFGGWGFQSHPDGVTTNLAVRKMYLGTDPNEVLQWIEDPALRDTWPPELRDRHFSPDKPIPRALIQLYVKWRRNQVSNALATYHTVVGEAMEVVLTENRVGIALRSGELIEGDRVVMASGSITVKVPDYLQAFRDHEQVIIDPLTAEGHAHRKTIPSDARVLILGTGLTGEEQATLLLDRGLTQLTLHSRTGQMHYPYPEEQKQKREPLVIEGTPAFLSASTPEEFDAELRAFYQRFLDQGYSQEDILAALRPSWDDTRKQLGGCVKAAERLRRNRRSLAVNSIGTTYEAANRLHMAEADGHLQISNGDITSITAVCDDALFTVNMTVHGAQGTEVQQQKFDWIINAVGRNIIRHPIWETLLERGIAKKHAGIGIRVNEKGQMIDAHGNASTSIWVVGMARAGDHALRHGYLGNLAFNLPQVRAHVYTTAEAILDSLSEEAD